MISLNRANLGQDFWSGNTLLHIVHFKGGLFSFELVNIWRVFKLLDTCHWKNLDLDWKVLYNHDFIRAKFGKSLKSFFVTEIEGND